MQLKIVGLVLALLVSQNGFSEAMDYAELQKETLKEFSDFGQGVNEAIRGQGKRKLLPEARVPLFEDEQKVLYVQETGAWFSTIWLKHENSGDVGIPKELSVSKKGFRLPANLEISKSTKNEIIAAFGKPVVDYSGQLEYSVPGYAGNDRIKFALENEKLSSVVWLWFIE